MDQFEAAESGNLQWFIAQQLSNVEVDVNHASTLSWTALELAIINNHVTLTRYLIEQYIVLPQCTLDNCISQEDTLRVLGCRGHLEMIQYLFEESILKDVLDIKADQHGVFRYAVEHNHIHLVKYLLEDCPERNKIDVAALDQYAIGLAAENGHLELVKYLIDECPQHQRVNVLADNAYTLRYAAAHGQLEVLKYLLEECSYCSQFCLVIDDVYVLTNAAVGGYMDCLNYLLTECPQRDDTLIAHNNYELLIELASDTTVDMLRYILNTHIDLSDVKFSNIQQHFMSKAYHDKQLEVIKCGIEHCTLDLTQWFEYALQHTLENSTLSLNIYLIEVLEAIQLLGLETTQKLRMEFNSDTETNLFSVFLQLPTTFREVLAKSPESLLSSLQGYTQHTSSVVPATAMRL